MSEETVLKKYGGTVIYVTQAGKFGARIKGQAVEKRTLREIERAITKALHAVTVMSLESYGERMGIPRLVKIATYDEKKDVYVSETGETIATYRGLYHVNEEALAQFKTLDERKRALEIEWERLRNTLTPFKRDDLAAMQAYDALAGETGETDETG